VSDFLFERRFAELLLLKLEPRRAGDWSKLEERGGCWTVPRPLISAPLATSKTFFNSGSSGTGVTLLQIARAVIRSLTLFPWSLFFFFLGLPS